MICWCLEATRYYGYMTLLWESILALICPSNIKCMTSSSSALRVVLKAKDILCISADKYGLKYCKKNSEFFTIILTIIIKQSKIITHQNNRTYFINLLQPFYAWNKWYTWHNALFLICIYNVLTWAAKYISNNRLSWNTETPD
jgi:hypothetical protein